MGEAFLKVHRPADFKLRQPQENTDAPKMKAYMCVNRSCLAHTCADMYVVLVMYTQRQVQFVESEGSGGFLSVHRPADVKLGQPPCLYPYHFVIGPRRFMFVSWFSVETTEK